MLYIENIILDFLQKCHNPILDSLMVAITTLGDHGILWIIIGIFLLFHKKTRKCGSAVLVVLIFCLLIGNLGLKLLVARPRPCHVNTDVLLLIKTPMDYSFPSGHSMSSFAAAVVIFHFHRLFGMVTLCLAAAIAFSRLYLYVHYPSDVLAGAVIGILLAFLSVVIVKKVYILTMERANRV